MSKQQSLYTLGLLILILLSWLLLNGCGRSGSAPAGPSTLAQLDVKLEQVRSWAPVCSATGAPTKRPASIDCDDGDGLLWAGLSCFAGTSEAACQYVRASQGADGRMWRSPQLVDKDNKNSFSRDMALGFLSYVARTGDTGSLDRWIAYINANSGKMCPDGTDNRCDPLLNVKALIKAIHRGADISAVSPQVILTGLTVSAATADTGFPLHLIAVELILLKELGFSGHSTYKVTADSLHSRQSRNPLFAYLAGHNDTAVELMLEQIPSARPDSPSEWSFEREQAGEAWRKSMGWEFLFLRKLLGE